MKTSLLLVLTFLLTLAPGPAAEKKALPARQVFQVRGVIKRVKPAEKTAIIHHEEIPDYMAAMTMSFTARDPKEFEGLQPGDAVTFRFIVTDDDEWVEDVKKLAPPAAPKPEEKKQSQGPIHFPSALRPGDPLPDFALIDQRGATVTPATLRGAPVAVLFFCVRAPHPALEPRVLAAQAPAGARLLFVTLDPGLDTPAALARFAESRGLDPARCAVVTGEEPAVRALADAAGVVTVRDGAVLRHNVRALLINAAGRVHSVLRGRDWGAPELYAQLGAASGPAQVP